MPENAPSSEELLALFWQHMQEGCEKRGAPYHLAHFSYLYQGTPEACIVVLRHALREQAMLGFHTDVRQKKVAALEKSPICHLLFYSTSTKIQWRLKGICKIQHRSTSAKQAWDNTPVISRTCYTQDQPPGDKCSHPSIGFSDTQWQHRTTETERTQTYHNFCLIEFYIQSIEWLQLSAQGHLRHQWTRAEASSWDASWMHP